MKMLKYILPLTLISAIIYFTHNEFVFGFALSLALAAWIGFVVWYNIRSKWWKNPYGRNTMGISFGIVLVLALVLTRSLYGYYDNYEVLWTYIMLYLGVLGLHRTYHMDKAQREK